METVENANFESELRAFLDGDSSAFEKLYERYRPLLSSLVMRYAGEASGDELHLIASEAFHNAALHYESHRGVTFGLYAKICVNRALAKHVSDEQKQRAGSNGVDVLRIGVSPLIESRMIGEELVSAVLASVRSIASELEYEVFRLIEIDGLTAKEAASRLGQTVRQVENAIYRLRKKSRENKELFSYLY